ncbi:MAG: hypothetical protein QXM65_07835 [Candidatus Bathyarchaeia archaeon]
MKEVELRDVIRPGTTRGLDFVILDELRNSTGVNPESVLKFALVEMLCNSLDKEDASNIRVEVRAEGDFHAVAVSDNGSKKLTAKELKLILDFESKASSKRGFYMVSRGYLGNALKCIFGYAYALAESKELEPPPVMVESGNYVYKITLKPDKIKEVINSKISVSRREDNGFTKFTVKFPRLESQLSVLKDLVFATSMVNPFRKITYDIFGDKGVLGSDGTGKPIRKETSVLWYTSKQFLALYSDFVKATPNAKLKEFIPLFRGFTSKKLIWEILQELNATANHDSGDGMNMQFLPATPIKELSENVILALFKIMKAKSKPIGKRSIRSVLGCVGEEAFENIRRCHGWQRLRYVVMTDTRRECWDQFHYSPNSISDKCTNIDHVEFPYLVELAIFDRNEDGEGLKVYQCVNFMASMEDIFSRIFNIPYRLGRVGIAKDTPVTVVAHLVSPVLKWLNYGKSGLGE